MKKALRLLLAGSMVLSLAACGGSFVFIRKLVN